MSEESKENFFVEGIRRYPQAVATIEAFEAMLHDRLRNIAKAYSHEAFNPAKLPVKTGISKGTWGQTIWASPEGALRSRKGAVWLEFGVWWQDGEVALYCNFVDTRSKVIDLEYRRNHPRVEVGKWSENSRLFMALSSSIGSSALDEQLKILLDELMASVK